MPSYLQQVQLNDGHDMADTGEVLAVAERRTRRQHDILGARIASMQDDAICRDQCQPDDRVNAADQENVVLPILHVLGREFADEHVAGSGETIDTRCRHLGCPELRVGRAEPLEPFAPDEVLPGRCAVYVMLARAKIEPRKQHSIRVLKRARIHWRCDAVDQPLDGNIKGLSDPNGELRIRHGLRDDVVKCPRLQPNFLRQLRAWTPSKHIKNARTPRRDGFFSLTKLIFRFIH